MYPPMGNPPNLGYPPVDTLRSTGPSQVSPGAFAPQQFSPVLGTAQMYQYPPQFYSPPQPPVQGQQPGAGRRGRVSRSGHMADGPF